MAISISLINARVTSLTMPNISTRTISYVLGFLDANSVYRDMYADANPYLLMADVTPGDIVYTTRYIANLVRLDCIANLGDAPDTITVEEDTYNSIDLP